MGEDMVNDDDDDKVQCGIHFASTMVEASSMVGASATMPCIAAMVMVVSSNCFSVAREKKQRDKTGSGQRGHSILVVGNETEVRKE